MLPSPSSSRKASPRAVYIVIILVLFAVVAYIVGNAADPGVDVTLHGDGIVISNSGEILEGVVLTINDECRARLGSIAPGEHGFSKEELRTIAGCSWADAEVVHSIVLTATRAGTSVNLHAAFVTARSR